MNEEQKAFLNQMKNFIDNVTVRKDWLYIFDPCSIGDFLYNGGLSRAVQKRKNKSAVVLVVKDRMRNLHLTYENFAQILYYPDNVMNAVQLYFYETSNYESDNYIYGHFKMKPNGNHGEYFFSDENLHLIDRYKKDVFSIPQDTPYEMPIVEDISRQDKIELAQRYTLDKDKTVIILPYVHSTRQLSMDFWESLAFKLKQRGCIVYTNTDGFSEKPVAGTEAISPNFPQLYFLSDKVRCFIGSRSGIFDFLALTEAKILNINSFPDWIWEVGILYPECNNRTFYDAVDYLKPVAEYFEKGRVDAEISISHPKINPADVFFDYETMTEEILNGV